MDNNRNLIRIIILLTGLLVGILSALKAQPGPPDHNRPFQLTFLYPLGTNGIQSDQYLNSFSLNILGGVSGGTSGFEVGGLFNVDLGAVRGAQLGGITNFVHGNFHGAQFAGMANLNNGSSRGAFFAALTNISIQSTHGAHFAGLTNIGLKQSGSTQIAGITNLSVESSRGLQLAGIANISVKEHLGAQISGILNYTTSLNGFQMALINVSDTVEKGTPFGLLSFVRHGYFHAELEFNELFPMNLSIKTGVRHLYNIFSISYRPMEGKQYWGLTYGLGTYFLLNEKLSMNLDLTATHINEGESWTDVLNMVNRLRLNMGYRFHKHLEIYGGLSFNVAVSHLTNPEGRISGSSLIPSYTFYEEIIRASNVKMYPGFNLGIRF